MMSPGALVTAGGGLVVASAVLVVLGDGAVADAASLYALVEGTGGELAAVAGGVVGTPGGPLGSALGSALLAVEARGALAAVVAGGAADDDGSPEGSCLRTSIHAAAPAMTIAAPATLALSARPPRGPLAGASTNLSREIAAVVDRCALAADARTSSDEGEADVGSAVAASALSLLSPVPVLTTRCAPPEDIGAACPVGSANDRAVASV